MQLKKASKKTSNNAEKPVAAAPESAAAAEVTAKPRVSRSSKTKKSEGQEMTSGRNIHKPASPVLAEPVVVFEETGSAPRLEKKSATHVATDEHAVAQLAYAYWVERGHKHGHAEEDWLRAEKALAVAV